MIYTTKKIALVLCGLVIIVGGWFWVYASLRKSPPITNVSTSSYKLVDVCSDCSIVGGTEEESTVYNLHTGKSHSRTVSSTAASVNMTHNRYLAPSRSQEAVVSQSATELYLVNFSTGLDKKIYTSPIGQGIGNVVWAGYERYVYFGQGPVTSDVFPQTNVQTIMAYDILQGTSRNVVNISQIGREIQSVNIIGVSTDTMKIALAYDQNGLKYAVWDVARQKLYPLSISSLSQPIFVLPSADGLEVDKKYIGALLWSDKNILHLLQLSDYHDTVRTLTHLASSSGMSPISIPSPAGNELVYLRQDISTGPKQLVLLDILSGQERILDFEIEIDNSLISSTLWIPDATKIVLPIEWNNGLPQYAALSVDPHDIWVSPKPITDTVVPSGYTIEGFFIPTVN